MKRLGVIVSISLLLSPAIAATESSRTWLHQFIAAKAPHPVAETTTASIMRTSAPNPHPADFYQTHAVLFLFSSNCPHCHNQAPVLKQWAHLVGAHVVAYSLDGHALPDFAEALPAPSALVATAFAGLSIRYPALFFINKKTHTLYPVAIGELDARALNRRVAILQPKIIAFEEGLAG